MPKFTFGYLDQYGANRSFTVEAATLRGARSKVRNDARFRRCIVYPSTFRLKKPRRESSGVNKTELRTLKLALAVLASGCRERSGVNPATRNAFFKHVERELAKANLQLPNEWGSVLSGLADSYESSLDDTPFSTLPLGGKNA